MSIFDSPTLSYMVYKSRTLCVSVHWCSHRTETRAWHIVFTEHILVELLNLNSRDNGFRKHMGIPTTSTRFQNAVPLLPPHTESGFAHIFMTCKNRNGPNTWFSKTVVDWKDYDLTRLNSEIIFIQIVPLKLFRTLSICQICWRLDIGSTWANEKCSPN